MSEPGQNTDQAAAGSVDLSILTVGYNSAPYLAKCIESLGPALEKSNVEMLFINNGTDQSEDLIEQMAQQVRIAPSQGNIGFGRANNVLAALAKGKWLLLLNPDTEASAQAIDALLSAATAYPDYAILGALTLTHRDGSTQFPQMELPGMRSLARGLIGRAAKPLPSHHDGEVIPVNCVSGGCMMIRRDVWDQLGGFDEAFFLYTEDIDLCKRAQDREIKLGIALEARIFHDLGSGDYFSPNRLLLQMRGNAHYFRKHFRPLHAFGCLSLLWLSAMVRFCIGALMGLTRVKYRRMSRGFRSIALRPWQWWGGYRENASRLPVGENSS